MIKPAKILSMKQDLDYAPHLREALRLEVYNDVTPLYPAWCSLEQRTPDATIFQSADWCQAWVEAAAAAGVPENVRIVVIWRGDRLVLLWPLAIRRLSLSRILHSLAEPATQYTDVLLDPGEDSAELMTAVWAAIHSWTDIDAVELRRVRAGTPITRLKNMDQHFVEGSRASAPILDFRQLKAGSPADHRTSRSRNALRRHQRQLAEIGPVAIDIVDPSDQCEALAEAVRLKRLWQEEKAIISSGYAHPASEGSLARLASKKSLFIARLRVGDETAAIELGAIRDGRYWSLVQSYDFRFSKHAPGRLLFWHLLERCPHLSIDVFDFLAPAHPHKLEWANDEVEIGDYLVPMSIKGRAAVSYLSAVKPMLRDFYIRLPADLRRHAARLLGSFG